MARICSHVAAAAPSGVPRSSSLPACRPSAPSVLARLRPALIAAFTSAVLFMTGTPAFAQPTTAQPIVHVAGAGDLAAFVAEASRQFGIPASWIRAVMRAESFGDKHAISPKGAMGLMQIMPDTWAALRQRYRLGGDPYDVHDNILAGAAYLRELHDRYGIPGFLAAYNAGPARWENYLATGRPLPEETRTYLARLAPIVGGGAADDTALLASVVRSWTEAPLFPKQSADASDAKSSVGPPQRSNTPAIIPPQDWTGLAPQSNGLFVALSSARPPR
ncbi:lytic transglycosylase domain-containing protein [Azorhizobium caulinodans]|uniref:lytic transglycosylase domain-containing protein n=1 Tax=Azorhizobium caulinodans TaxID=7 RepID=UPI002FBDFA7A